MHILPESEPCVICRDEWSGCYSSCEKMMFNVDGMLFCFVCVEEAIDEKLKKMSEARTVEAQDDELKRLREALDD